MPSSSHWSRHLQSSNQQGGSPYTEATLPSKRKWKLGATVFSLLSIAGGLLVNNHMNPAVTVTTTPVAKVTGGTTKPDKTVTSDAIPYQFGTVQLSVTRKAGKISAIDIGQSTASNGRESAYPYLVQYAIKAQGTSFGNLGGATYTTDAFKAALDSAITKLG
jgi:uncharacterized protein with FMN-binding domain